MFWFLYFRLILNEFNALIKIGDIALVTEVHSLGVKLFYTFMSECTLLRTCSPIEKFVLAVLQSLGNVCNSIHFCLNLLLNK